MHAADAVVADGAAAEGPRWAARAGLDRTPAALLDLIDDLLDFRGSRRAAHLD
jgi:hypothetical protein